MSYRLDAPRVAKTLRARGISKIPESDQGFPLFVLSADSSILESPFGTVEVDSEALSSTLPDPLWESSAGICAHMEQDHPDTFSSFLRMVGSQPSDLGVVTMPWVEESGFFLSVERPDSRDHVWIPFPHPCPTPNQVRKVLISMLKEARRDQE